MIYRKATIADLKAIGIFTDFWLSGRGKRVNAFGAVDDCFITKSQHRKYIERYRTFLCLDGLEIIGWSVIEKSGTMIHLLVAGNYRGKGIGKEILKITSPQFIRSKSDQSSGNPIWFYKNQGYKIVSKVRSRSRLDIDVIKPNRDKNIDILELSRNEVL